jgi:peptidoglycan hydrolase-like protein with peptidoglycan-binding domain
MARLKKKKRMTATTLSHLPLQAGSALATGVGRAILWGISRYARAPLANTSILALTVFTAMAGSNALYFQDHRHPSPFFAPALDIEIGLPETVTPATRKSAVTLPPIVVIDETGSVRSTAPVNGTPATEPIGNAAVIELQRKLTSLGLYEGKVDGVFGPKTSGAIRRFEERSGLPPKGELSDEILDAVARAPIVLPQATGTPPRPLAVVPLKPAVQPQIVVVEPQTVQPAAVATTEITGSIPPANIGNPAAPEDSFQPLPTPEPLVLSVEAATSPKPLVRRDLPDSPREVLSIAVATAKNGIQALASVLENGPQLGPINPPIAEIAPRPATQSVQPALQAAAEPVIKASVQQPMPPLPETIAAPVEAPVVVADIAPETIVTAPPSAEAMTDRELVAKVQRGLTSLGFLRGEIDGVPGEATAKAIRNFEVYYNYNVTGRVTPSLVDLLVAAGAQI